MTGNTTVAIQYVPSELTFILNSARLSPRKVGADEGREQSTPFKLQPAAVHS